MDTTEKNATLHQGSVLQNGRYTIVSVLGQGGFGITYQATTKEKVTGNLGEMEVEVPVAIKEFFMKDTCLRDSYNNNVSIPSTGSTDQVDKYRQKFIKEAHNLAQLNHPNIVHVADVFEENNTVYYVMQYLRDGSLRGKLRTQGRLPEDEAVRYTLEIAHALDYMHTEKHMCHYDVKPGNILLNNDKAMLIWQRDQCHPRRTEQRLCPPGAVPAVASGLLTCQRYLQPGCHTLQPHYRRSTT